MSVVFLSYAHRDHHFADLLALKMKDAGIDVWRDNGSLRPGRDWRRGIEHAISNSVAVVVAISKSSSESSYCTFEWSYALGNGRDLIPLKLEECAVHPRLASIQHLDFSIIGALPWETLVESIREIETNVQREQDLDVPAPSPAGPQEPTDTTARAILAYLNQRGYQAISYERVRQRIDASLTDERLNALVLANPTVFRQARLKTRQPGLAKHQP
ncbi:MAG: hypothetical protein C4K60_05070 [Ideonella sp. MAG2]|nr:MAG: hypothetical protein C4K60_05070 [Ideonella sp. MAG2]